MTEDDKKKVIAFLAGKIGRCTGCGVGAHTVDELVTAPVFDPKDGGVLFGGPRIPLVVIMCTTCARITFYAAAPMGLIPSEMLVADKTEETRLPSNVASPPPEPNEPAT